MRFTAFFLLTLALFTAGAALMAQEPKTPDEVLREADRQFARKTMKEAIAGYEQFLEAAPGHAEAPRAKLRIAEALLALNQRWPAVEKLTALRAETEEGSRFRAEVSGLLGATKARYWGGSKEVVAILDDAVAIWAKAGETGRQVEVLFDLAYALSHSYDYGIEFSQWQEKYWRPDPEQIEVTWEKYSRDLMKAADDERLGRAVETYERILAVSDDPDQDQQALYRLGCLHVNVLARTFRANVSYYAADLGTEAPAEMREVLDRYEAEIGKGIAAWRRLLAEHPGGKLADDAQYLTAFTLQQRLNDFTGAMKEYAALLENFPSTEWADTARAEMQEIAKPEIRLEVPKPYFPGANPKIGLAARNVADLALTAYRLDLPALLRGDYRFHEIDGIDATALTPFKTWTVATGAGADHKGVQKELEIPFSSPGAFLIEAAGETATCRALVVISATAVVVKSADDGLTLYSADAESGEPRSGVAYLVKASWRVGRVWYAEWFEATSGDGGVARVSFAGHPQASRARIDLVGVREDDVALVTTRATSATGTQPYRIHTSTDRPVYRPNQTVHLKCIVRSAGEQGYRVPAGTAVRVEIQNPRGEKVFEKTLVTNDRGTLAADLALAEEPPLGLWTIRTFIGKDQYYSYHWTGAQFRVEEYKKPEFEVKVAAGEGRVKPGTNVRAEASADYYFGAPVAHAETAWRVYREPYVHWIPVRRKFGWYYEDMYPNPRQGWGRELVAEGTGLTDETGKFAVTFTAKDYGDDWDSRFRVEVDVTDASRRQISGSATIFATRKPFFVRLEPPRSLYQPGDAVEVEIRAEDANGHGVASAGKLVLARRVDREEEKDGEKVDVVRWEDVGSVMAATREDGDGTARMVVDEAGQFRLTYVSAGEDDVEVTGETFVWVVTHDFAGSQYRFSGVTVLTDKDTYAVGDGIEILVNSQFPDAIVLLTVEADDRILDQRVVRTAGKVHVEKMTVGEGWTPNVYVKALTIRDSAVYHDRRQVIVPPVAKFMDVAIAAPKEGTFRPGEAGEFTVTTTGADGKPVAAELSVVFFDKSILYIQPDMTPDLRRFFYGDKRADRVRLASSFDFRSSGAERMLPGHELSKYRSLGQPEFMNPWFYNFEGMNAELAEEWGAKNAPIGGGGGFGGRGGSRRRAANDGGPPAPPSAAMAANASGDAEGGEADGSLRETLGKGQGGAGAEPEVRQFFPDTAFWDPMVVTGADGKATVTVRVPDSLTTWKAVARGATTATAVGEAESETVVTKNLVIRLQAPRFFRERDEVVVSGIVHNFFDVDLPVRITIATEGGALELLSRGELSRPDQTITVAAGKEQRVDWWFKVARTGKASIRVDARTDRESDAMTMGFPVYEHGVEKYTALSGSLTAAGETESAEMSFVVPEDRHEDVSDLTVTVSPSLASTLLETLPYLADYPHGCVEQTMSRFLPSVVVKKTLLDLGYTLTDLGVAPTREVPAGYWGRPEVQKLKVLRDEDLAKAVADGIRRLADFQNGDGSWGWFRGSGADVMMTAYVVRGLSLAGRAGAEVDRQLLQKGANFLYAQLVNSDPKERAGKGMTMDVDLLTAAVGALLDVASLKDEPGALADRIVDWLFENREKLGAVSRARLAIALHRRGRAEDAGIVCENLTDLALVDRENGTARFGRAEGYYRWRDDAVTGTAETLRAYLLVKPESDLIPMMVKWLVSNRRGATWKSTMDTAHAVLALCDYLKASKELVPDLTVTLSIDDRITKTIRVTKENLFTLDNTLTLTGADLPAGRHVVRIRKEGTGNLYFEGHLTVYTREEGVKAAGNEIGIARKAWRIHARTREVTRKEWVRDHYEERVVTEPYEEAEPLENGAVVNVGDLIDVELVLTAKNDYSYLVFSDFRGAGFEPVDRTSGHAGGGILTYRELRDERTDFFASRLPQGEHRVRYRVRAEIPGTFHVMPTTGFAMYLPEVRAISDEMILTVTEPGVR